ncbi:MAG: hypothetical protein RDV48_16115 [Candidatus Eremiobacteraeota bacterium]|nr:hypothetical protein [Candidatus Eremiobacteraeota bacterium]
MLIKHGAARKEKSPGFLHRHHHSGLLLGCLLIMLTALRSDVFADDKAPEIFHFTDAHRAMLREARMVWDPTENGAPTVHPAKPFGSENLYGDIARICGLTEDRGSLKSSGTQHPETRAKAESLFTGLLPAMQILLSHGALKEGTYTLRVREPVLLVEGLTQVDFVRSEEAGKVVAMPVPRLRDKSSFHFTDDHRRLVVLASFMLEPSRWAEDSPGVCHPVPALDPKRPYGDMTYYPLDIEAELKIPLDNPRYDDNTLPFSIPKLRRLVKLHLDMLAALHLYLQEAEVRTGEYVRKEDSAEWRKP